MRRSFITLVVVAAAMALPGAASAAKLEAPLAYGVQLLVNESLPGFTTASPNFEIPQGTAKFTVIVPKSAVGKHGVGIDGGPYNDIAGASVAPGLTTSLTIAVTPGDYTIYDSYKSNRKKGYSVKLRVTHAKMKRVSYGTRCKVREFFDIFSITWVKGVSCAVARELRERVDKRHLSNFSSVEPMVDGEFTCYFNPNSAIGMKTACLAGNARVTWTG